MAAEAPWRFFDLHVVRAERLSPHMARVTFGADDLGGFVSGGRDQRIKLFFPHPGQEETVVPRSPEDWFGEWRALDPDVRGIMRTYTVRAQRAGEVDIDFALHGDVGPASRWAGAARPGHTVVALGPTLADNGGVEFEPPAGTGSFVIAGDETALPAIGAILDWLPAGGRARVWIEVPEPADRQDLRSAADTEITWVEPGTLIDTIRAADLPADAYCWIAGEAGAVRGLRRHLVNERGYDRSAVEFMGYWRRGAGEEQLLAESLAGQNPHTGED
ncbi:siderophore-interacting protein [Spirillospora sp. NPDC047279]|uniref:siderophore-interacting protein n=1 Tax=Spirillospora sp. NPDC047279 TaxID=3155478 RepID=UPI0033E7988A